MDDKAQSIGGCRVCGSRYTSSLCVTHNEHSKIETLSHCRCNEDRMMHFLQRVPILKKAGSIWQRGRTSIFHLENYTPRSLELLLTEAGFRDIKIEIANELSWPVTRYIRTYLLEKQGLPAFLAPVFTPFLYPLLATNLFNANKAIVCARKAAEASGSEQSNGGR
jgi:hypothetical protein